MSAHRAGPTFAPASAAMAFSSFGFTDDSGKIVETCSRRIVSTRARVSPADARASVDSAGMTAPTTVMP